MDLTQKEYEDLMEIGLQKVAYEEGIKEYSDALEKVASVHGVDAKDLHEALEKEAAGTRAPQAVGRSVGGGAARGGALGGALGGASQGQGRVRELIDALKQRTGASADQVSELIRNLSRGQKLGLGAGAAGAGAGAGLGIRKLLQGRGQAQEQAQEQEKTSSVDEKYLVEKGIEALKEMEQ